MTTGEFDPNKQYQQPGKGSTPPPPAFGGAQYGGLAGPTQQPVIGARPPAPLVQRVLARVIDLVVVGILIAVINFVSGISTAVEAETHYEHTGFRDVSTEALLGTVGSTLVVFGFFVVFEVLRGRTIGKRLFGFRVQGPGGALKPNLKQSAIRNSFLLLGVIPAVGWLLVLAAAIFIAVTIHNSPTKQGWHDRTAGGTQVVDA